MNPAYQGQLDVFCAAYAVINGYVIYILMMITQAVTGGIHPIASFNLGEKMYGRIRQLIKVSMIGNVLVVGRTIYRISYNQVVFLFLQA